MRTCRRSVAVLFTVVGVALGTALGTAPGAAAKPPPSPEGKRAGITRHGEAYMGWREPRVASPSTKSRAARASVEGIDVASHQGNVDWSGQWGLGKRFAYVKATEGLSYRNPYFAQQYNGSYDVGMIRGAYHFANPDSSTGAAQAEYFVRYGGGWSRDGKTLPGVLDIEWNPYGSDDCWGLTDRQMVSWISSFTSRFKQLTGRDAVIYTNTYWWKDCTGNTSRFGSTNPLWIARYSTSPGELPAGWGYHTFWQYTDVPIDQDRFNGSLTRLKALANG